MFQGRVIPFARSDGSVLLTPPLTVMVIVTRKATVLTTKKRIRSPKLVVLLATGSSCGACFWMIDGGGFPPILLTDVSDGVKVFNSLDSATARCRSRQTRKRLVTWKMIVRMAMDMLSQIERKPKLTTASPMIVALVRIERTLSGVKSFGMNGLVVELDMMMVLEGDVGLRLRKVGRRGKPS